MDNSSMIAEGKSHNCEFQNITGVIVCKICGFAPYPSDRTELNNV